MRTMSFCIAILSISLVGCNSSGDEIRAYALEAQQILDRLDAYQEVVEELASPDQLAAVTKINRAIDDLKNRLARIAAAIGSTQFTDEHTMVNSLTALRTGGVAAGAFPYGGQVSLALLALTGIVGVWGRKQAATRKLAEATVSEIVKSIDKAEEDGIVKLSALVQGSETRRAVREIQAA